MAKNIRLACQRDVNNTIEWLKDGRPLYIDYDHLVFIKDDLLIRAPFTHLDNGNYFCNGEFVHSINRSYSENLIPDIEETKETSIDLGFALEYIFDTLLKYQHNNPLVTVVMVGILALLLITILSRIAAIYSEASANYAKYKFMKKRLNLKRAVEECKAKKKPIKMSKMAIETEDRMIKDEKWSLVL